jgi:flagellar motor switch protein FliN/FliY
LTINPETIDRLNSVQESIWAAAANKVTEGFGKPANFVGPLTAVAKQEDLATSMPGPMVAMQFGLSSAPHSEHLVLISPEFAIQLAAQNLDADVPELTDEVLANVTGAFQSIIQGLCEGISHVTGDVVSMTTFALQRSVVELPAGLQGTPELVRVQVHLTVGDASGTLIWVLDEESAKQIPKTVVFHEVAGQSSDSTDSRITSELDVILDIPLEVSVELGRMTMVVKDVIDLGTGSIVEVDKAAGDPVDVLVNGKLVARGEVVVIEDNFGVRITEILSPKERVTKLAEAA